MSRPRTQPCKSYWTLTGWLHLGAQPLDQLFDGDKMVFLCGQEETTERGYKHYQAVVKFKEHTCRATVEDTFSTGAWTISKRMGCMAEAIEYTAKEASRTKPWAQYGKMPVKNGSTGEEDAIWSCAEDDAL